MNTASQFPVRGFEKNRIEALVDGIFAVALTLLVLDIKLPEAVPLPTNDALWKRLLDLERHFAIYVISFVVIAIYWVAHHVQFHYVRYTDRRMIWINMFFLLLITFVPFVTDLVGDHEGLILPVEIYGATLLALSALSFANLAYLAHHPHLATADLTPLAVRLLKRRIAFFMLVPAASMALAFVSTRLALYAYFLLATVHFLPASIDEHIRVQRGGTIEPSSEGAQQ